MACSESYYISSAAGKLERLARICQIIDALEAQQILVVGNSDVDEYSIDDGQIKVRTIYRSAADLAKAITAYDTIKERLLNQLNGRGAVLRPWQGMQ